MKPLSAAAVAALALTGLCWGSATRAQGVPQGSYLRSCTNVSVRGDALVAVCRNGDRQQQTELRGFKTCIGDVANINGVLHCGTANGGQLVGQVTAPPPRTGGPMPPPPDARYGGGAAPGGYGYAAGRERCEGLRRESSELRSRLEREWNPAERARTEERLREVHEQEERCR